MEELIDRLLELVSKRSCVVHAQSDNIVNRDVLAEMGSLPSKKGGMSRRLGAKEKGESKLY